MTDKTLAVEFQDVGFFYEGFPVLEKVNLAVQEGDFLGVIGPNGGGKTTLLKLVLGLLRPHHGKIRIFGHSARQARHLIGYVPQYVEFDSKFPIKVMDVVLMGRLEQAPTLLRYRPQDRQAAQKALRSVEIWELRDRPLSKLSGGQRQRVLIARALAGEPKLLLLDEPTASVDSRVEQDIYDLLSQLNEKMTIILVTHDLGFISAYVNKVACTNRNLSLHSMESLNHESVEGMYGSSMQMIKHECNL